MWPNGCPPLPKIGDVRAEGMPLACLSIASGACDWWRGGLRLKENSRYVEPPGGLLRGREEQVREEALVWDSWDTNDMWDLS